MTKRPLTMRQQRESAYYDQYSRLTAPREVDFAPISSRESRPWNDYWYLCEQVVRHFRAGTQRLLDFGCGPGEYAVLFAKLGYEVHGFDISPGNVAHAEWLSQQYGLADRTRFTVAVAEDLPYPSDFFDIAVGVDILHHVEIGPALRECLRTLKPGGIALFREPVAAPIFDTLRNTRLVKAWVPNAKSFERHITDDERKLSAADLRAIRELCPRTTLR
jgi:SAM-dependent methyltransferase